MKIVLIVNDCPWESWGDKTTKIQQFYRPLVSLDITIRYTFFNNIPITNKPGMVTIFSSQGAQDVPGTDLQVDPAWFQANVASLITGYDIAIFQMSGIVQNGLPLGLFIGSLNGTRVCYTFVNGEDDQYLIPDPDHPGEMVSYGNEAECIIEHEIAHALFNITGQNDNTHLYWYSNQFGRILTDIKMPNVLISLYQQLIPLLQQWLGLLKQQKNMPENSSSVAASNPDVPNPDWTYRPYAYHNVRVICDLAGLSLAEKNLICACIRVESDFDIGAKHENKDANGNVLSTDWGIVQVNDFYHIGPGKDFPDVEYVLSHPQECVQYMVNMYKHGLLKMWVSFSSGAYKQYL